MPPFSRPVTQGGQTFLHRMRMLGQIIRFACFFSSMISFLTFCVLCYRTFSEKHMDLYIKACHARVYQSLFGPQTRFDGHAASYWVRKTAGFLHWIHQKLFFFALYSLITGLGILVLILVFWQRQGTKAHRQKTITGNTIETERTVSRAIFRNKQASPIKLMHLPLIKDTETQHMLVTGTTGSGKTNAMKHICNQIRHERAIIVDTNGAFLDRYYDPRCDVVLNPFDSRFPGWDLWGECEQTYHYDEIAENLIPPSEEHDQFWTQSSRTLLSEILKLLHTEEKCTISKILEYASILPLGKLYEALAHTQAASLIDPNSEKTAASIRMNMASHISCLESLRKQPYDHPFSIRRWVQNTDQKGWLFLQMTPAQRATLRPLLSCWLSVAMKSLMACAPDHNPHLWFMIDELPSLHKLPDLSLCLAEGRKYGACMVLGVQNIPQLETLYGPHITQSLIELCSTKLLFRCTSFPMAQRLSNLIGTQERHEMREGISYGAHDTRDGVSLHLQTREMPVIPPHELTNLPNLVSFVQLSQGYPITKIKWDIAQ